MKQDYPNEEEDQEEGVWQGIQLGPHRRAAGSLLYSVGGMGGKVVDDQPLAALKYFLYLQEE